MCYTGWCVALGGTTALDTLGSQAFTGGEHRTDVSIHLQRCILLLWLLFIPVAIIWGYADPVLRAFGQAERLSHDAQAFLRVLIVGAPGYIAFESVKKYLQCQGQRDILSFIHHYLTLLGRHYAGIDARIDSCFADQHSAQHHVYLLHAVGLSRIPRCNFHNVLAGIFSPLFVRLPLSHSQA